jgi:hypothetical protein
MHVLQQHYSTVIILTPFPLPLHFKRPVHSSTVTRGSLYQLRKGRLYSTEFYNNISSADKSLADEVVNCLSLMREGGEEEGRSRINLEISSVLEKIVSRPSLRHCFPLLIDEWLLHDLEMTASLYVLLVNYYLQGMYDKTFGDFT